MRALLLSTLALALTACATPTAGHSAPAGRDCFLNSQVSGYNVIDAHHVRLNAGAPNRHYILGTTWDARDLNWAERVAIHSTTDWICTGNGLGVEIIGGDPRRTYPVTEITREPPPPPQGS